MQPETGEEAVAHKRAVARRVLGMRLTGFGVLAIVFYFQRTKVSHGYLVFCTGAALLQLAYLDIPKPASINPISPAVLEYTNPRLYYILLLTSKAVALGSVVAQLWLGIYFLGWKILWIFIVVTVASGLLATRLGFTTTAFFGLVLSAFGLFFLFAK